MNRLKILFSVLFVVTTISSTILNTAASAEESIVGISSDEYSKEFGELREGFLHVTAVEAAQLLLSLIHI